MTALTLEALSKTFPRAGRVVDSIDLQIAQGEFFTFLGPSGCGKSTTLRMIAGFEEPTGGRILIENVDVTHDAPNRRGIGFVFQNYALFPHLSVAKNVAFGLQVRKLPRTEISPRVHAALQEVQLTGLDGARVDQLSGGQQQRVALARALVIRPKLLLLDEPLSNLDAKLREETRSALRLLHKSTRVTTIYVTHDQGEAMAMSDRIAVLHKRLQVELSQIHREVGTTFVYVTHDQEEAMTMADRVAVLKGGRIEQIGVPEEIYKRPRSRFVADFIGRNNILDATVVRVSEHSAAVRFSGGAELTLDSPGRAPGIEISPGTRVGVCLRAESLHLVNEDGAFSGVVTDASGAVVSGVPGAVPRREFGW